MIAARLSRDDCLLRGRYEPPAARRGSQVRPCRLLAALRSVSCVWPLLRSRQHCLSAGAYRCPLPVGGVLLAGGGRAPRQCPRALATLAPRHGGFLITLAAAGSRRSVAAPTYAASCARGPPPRACAARGAPAPSRRPRSLRSRPARVGGASLRFGRAVLATLAGFFSATALGVAAAAGVA